MTLDSLPKRITAGEFEDAVLLGVTGDTAVYWHVPTDSVVEGGVDDQTGGDSYEFSNHDESDVESYVLSIDSRGWRRLTDLGRFLRSAAPFKGVRILTHRQAQAYALSQFTRFSRREVADHLGVSTNTFDDHRQTAFKKINNAAGLTAATNN